MALFSPLDCAHPKSRAACFLSCFSLNGGWNHSTDAYWLNIFLKGTGVCIWRLPVHQAEWITLCKATPSGSPSHLRISKNSKSNGEWAEHKQAALRTFSSPAHSQSPPPHFLFPNTCILLGKLFNQSGQETEGWYCLSSVLHGSG